ncbi:Uncharacterized protein PCOAH_00006680 [Plasmodium coatneyi]|uniref:Uncharacterized protein n=1 Tax=Plasmodium coatneyi TaxID=208452 RepID=A0A1B1DUI8_9APIC|nr:Uncharacterized protein PCOAH_00006680 [Plasmodium coatneyi]ANQ06440.1 Uncharacterized protein PCOAH_00006680 [Plasmodium coatneyi]
MDLFGEDSENNCCEGWGRRAHGRASRSGAVRGRLIKQKRNSEEREEETNLFSVSSGEDKRRTPGRKRGLFSESVNDEDSSGEDRKKNKKRRVRSKCLFSSTSDGGSHKSEEASEAGKLGDNSPQEGKSNCLFSNDVEEVKQGDQYPQEKISNSLFSSTSEETPQSGSEVKGKNKSPNGEGRKVQSRMYIREGNFFLNIGEKGKKKTRKKTSFSNIGLQGRSNIANKCGYRMNAGRSGKRDLPYYDLHGTNEEGMYRLISFEKLKKRASRKLNFMSIVNMANGGGNSSDNSSGSSSGLSSHSSVCTLVRSQVGDDAGDEGTDSTANSEEDILNRTGVSYVASSESTQESKNDIASVNDEISNNRTMDVYRYYYLGNHVDNLVRNKNVEKMEESAICIGGENLHDRLFGLGEGNSKELHRGEVTLDGMHKGMSKEETQQLDRGTSIKMKQPRNKIGKRNNGMLQRNLKLYRNFKNINVEVSRQNNLKGLNFKEMVVNFIRLVNKNVMEIGERGEMDLSKEGNNSKDDFNDTSDVEEWYVTRGDVTKGEETKTQASLQEAEGQHNHLEVAKCVCIFCSEKKKILTNEEMHVSTFKYMDERKEEDTVIKPFFMHNYVFTAFINYFIHYGRVTRVQGGKKTGGKNILFYKFDKMVTKKYGIKRVILFVAKRVTLTSVGIHMEGSNMLQEEEEFVVVINFFKWGMMRRRYKEIVKLKRRKKEKESLSIFKTFFFVVKAIDEYCILCNIQVDHPKGKKNFHEGKGKYMSEPFCKKEDSNPRNGCTSFDSSYLSNNEVRVGQIEDALNRDLANSRLQFALVDSLRVSAGSTLYLFPAHMLVLV